MAIISFATPKGGSGKTTLCILLAAELAALEASPVILDVDPQRSASQWRDRSLAAGRSLRTLTVETINGDDALAARIGRVKPDDIVLIDTQGAFNEAAAIIATRSDLIIIPARASMLDVAEAAKLVKFLKAMNAPAKVRLLFNDVDGIAANTRAYQSAVRFVKNEGIGFFPTGVQSRPIYKAAADAGGLLMDMPGEAASLKKARQNIQEVINEALAVLDD